MMRFKVEGMSCGHCAATVSGAIRAVAPGVPAEVDLDGGMVSVPDGVDPSMIVGAIAAAGYAAAAS